MRTLWSLLAAMVLTVEAVPAVARSATFRPAPVPAPASTGAPGAQSSAGPARVQKAIAPVPSEGTIKLLAKIPAGRAQPALGLGRRGAEIFAANCSPGCNWKQAVQLDVPPELAPSLESHLQTVKLGKGRSAAILRAPVNASEWAALVVADGGQSAPRVLFSGEVGFSGNPLTNSAPPMQLQVFEEAQYRQVILGRLDAALSLCGRQTLLEPRMLLPDDLQLHRVKLQRLPKAERDGAVTLTARPGGAQAPLALLKGKGASSGAGGLGLLQDGNAASAWTETRSGSGMGEFVVFQAPPNVPLAVVNLTLPKFSAAQTPDAQTPAGAAAPAEDELATPTSVWLVTDRSVFRVHLQARESTAAENAYQIQMPTPQRTSCVAIALDSASSDAPNARVGLSEISATAALTPDQVAQWVTALSQDPTLPGEPETSLLAVPDLAAPAIRLQFPKLNERGKVRALNVLDQWPCGDAVATYAAAWAGFSERVAPRLRACGKAAAPEVAARLTGLTATDPALAQLLTELDPALAVESLVPLLGQKQASSRAAIRRALRDVAERKVADEAILSQLRASLSRRIRLELLRALTPDLPRFRAAALPVLQSLLKGKASFRTRYLLIEPAAKLADQDADLEAFLAKLIRDDVQFPIRAQAVRAAPPTKRLTQAALGAIDDAHVRVRAAAVESLGRQRVSAAEPALKRRLEEDSWPLVRAAAVRALAALESRAQSKATLRINQALAQAAERDLSANVRRPALVALGQRRAREQLQVVRESFDVDEDVHVRAAAIEALGALCDRSAVDVLTKKALELGSFGAGEETYTIARSSLSALGRLNPPDLKQRLAPLFGKKVLRTTQFLARKALKHPSPCAAVTRARSERHE